MAACRARGVVATNTPDVLTNACADFTWALILAVTRRLGEGERVVRAGTWTGWALDYMLGMELRGKQLGIVGDGPHRPRGGGEGAGVRHAGGVHRADAGESARRGAHAARSAAGDVGRRVAALPDDATRPAT